MNGLEIYDENGNKTFDENSCKTRVEGVIDIEYNTNGQKLISLKNNQRIWAYPKLIKAERDIRVVVSGNSISWIWSKPNDYMTIRNENSFYSHSISFYHPNTVISDVDKVGAKIYYGTF